MHGSPLSSAIVCQSHLHSLCHTFWSSSFFLTIIKAISMHECAHGDLNKILINILVWSSVEGIYTNTHCPSIIYDTPLE